MQGLRGSHPTRAVGIGIGDIWGGEDLRDEAPPGWVVIGKFQSRAPTGDSGSPRGRNEWVHLGS